mgnify:CR=1 FL=1
MQILKTLALGGMILVCVALPGMAQVLTMFQPKNQRDRDRLRRSFNGLQGQKYLKIYQRGGRDVVEVTEGGKKKILEYKLNELKIKPSKSWDKKWRVVMFDIPERKRRARNALSRVLKEIGLVQLQKSVFIAPYECRNEIDFIANYFRVRDCVNYLEVTQVDHEVRLKQLFYL